MYYISDQYRLRSDSVTVQADLRLRWSHISFGRFLRGEIHLLCLFFSCNFDGVKGSNGSLCVIAVPLLVRQTDRQDYTHSRGQRYVGKLHVSVRTWDNTPIEGRPPWGQQGTCRCLFWPSSFSGVPQRFIPPGGGGGGGAVRRRSCRYISYGDHLS